MRWGHPIAAAAIVLAALGGPLPRAGAPAAPSCAAGGPAVVYTDDVTPSDAKTYRDLPFEVAAGVTRVEVGYVWVDALPLPDTPVGLVQTVFDLGLWDEGGVGTPEGFRGWSGSRQGKTAEGQDPIWVQADTAERGYRPDPVQPGTWNVDLGIAAVVPQGATYTVTVRCLAPAVGPPFVSQPVNPTHVADPSPGWYFGDFHMHGRHSNPNAPSWDGFVTFARAAGLDFLPVTDYVTNQHHRELGPVQAANPDLVVWPSREVITYFGHMTVFGETPREVDWRHGASGVDIGDIQRQSNADGALVGIAHPTIFPTAVFSSFCRGCEFTLGEEIDWDLVDTMEVLTGPVLVDDTELGGPGLGAKIENPFVLTALDLWHEQLRAGHKITAVAGSDDKLGPELGSNATAVYATALSRPALAAAVQAGHAYIRTEGVHDSPTLEMAGVTAAGERGIFGDTLHADAADVTIHVRGASGQLLLISKDGTPAGGVPITSDDFSHTFAATRDAGSGPLGTFWRVDTLATVDGLDGPHHTTIGNPLFLAAPTSPPTDDGGSTDVPDDSVPATDAAAPDGLPATGTSSPDATLLLLALGAVVATRRVTRR